MSSIKRFFIVIVLLITTIALFIVIGVLYSIKLKCSYYNKAIDNINGEIKIVFFSDLHASTNNNDDLLKLISSQNPNIITISGDIISRDSDCEDITNVLNLLQSLSKIAPTFLSLGNHEIDYISKYGNGILDMISETGASVLECEYIDLNINGVMFRLGGMSELAYRFGDGKYDPKAETFLIDFCDTEIYKVMLSHRPEAFGFKHACQRWNIDLILSGHTHGGLVRLPILGGLVAPIQGFFPKLDYGSYDLYDSEMIITSGLAGYEGLPRVFNPREICLITLTSKD